MMSLNQTLITLILVVGMSGCHNHEHEGHGHDHHDHHHHEDRFGVDLPLSTFTMWEDGMELFVEFPALVAGEELAFTAHLTHLDGHRPVEEGALTVRLGEREVVANAPLRPGVYETEVVVPSAGSHQLAFNCTGPHGTVAFTLGAVKVYPDSDAALASVTRTGSKAITLLKEQAWRMDFQTEVADFDEIYEVLTTYGVWQPSTSATHSLSAVVGGVVTFGSSELAEGVRVKKGQELLFISSEELTRENLGAQVEEAATILEQANSDYDRKKALYASRIIPVVELEMAESRYLLARANYDHLTQNYEAGRKQVVAPFNGTISYLGVDNGGYVSEGANLLRITSGASRLLEVHVPQDAAALLEQLHDLQYRPVGKQWLRLKKNGGKVLSVGSEVSPSSPMLKVLAVVNQPVDQPLGSFSEVQILYGHGESCLVVPETALMEDYGQYSVIVQTGGETYERRPVQTGRRNGLLAEIRSGLKKGERVVTKGAYQVRMAGMSGQLPAHGHIH